MHSNSAPKRRKAKMGIRRFKHVFCAEGGATTCTDGGASLQRSDHRINRAISTARHGRAALMLLWHRVQAQPPSAAGTWKRTVLYRFGARRHDGFQPAAALIMDKAGNLYGTTAFGGINDSGHGVRADTQRSQNKMDRENPAPLLPGTAAISAPTAPSPHSSLIMDASRQPLRNDRISAASSGVQWRGRNSIQADAQRRRDKLDREGALQLCPGQQRRPPPLLCRADHGRGRAPLRHYSRRRCLRERVRRRHGVRADTRRSWGKIGQRRCCTAFAPRAGRTAPMAQSPMPSLTLDDASGKLYGTTGSGGVHADHGNGARCSS